MAEFIFRLTIEGPEGTRSLIIPPGTSTIGRQAGTEIHLPDPLISRQHARIECSDRGCTLIDLGSANGTTLNNERLAANVPYPLADQATIQIGPFKLTYQQTEIVVAAPEPAPVKVEPPAAAKPASKEEPPAKAEPARKPPPRKPTQEEIGRAHV